MLGVELQCGNKFSFKRNFFTTRNEIVGRDCVLGCVRTTGNQCSAHSKIKTTNE